MSNLRVYITLLVLLSALSGCFGGRSTPSQYYVLTASAKASGSQTTQSVGVGPVQVAPFLIRPPIATHAGSGNMQVPTEERWSEPLDQGVQRVLAQDIAALTGASTRTFPWRQSVIPDFAVRLDVQDLDRLSDGSALIEVTWTLEDLKQNKLLQTKHERITVSAAGGYSGLVEAYSQLLAQLAARITQSLPAPSTEPAP